MAKISTTGYSILAMLTRGPVSTYELAQRMKLSFLRAIWPRADSRIYEEPKRLVSEGLASSTSEPSEGGRPRTVYRLTRKGRAALLKWVREPNARFRYRSEALLKVGFAHLGSREDLRRNIADLRAEALEDARIYLEVAEQAIATASPASDRAHLAALVDEFILEIIEARLHWARFAEEFSRTWSEPSGNEATAEQARVWWKATAERLRELIEEEQTRAA
jgi:DNA-binding PadR family transcriptional regulator